MTPYNDSKHKPTLSAFLFCHSRVRCEREDFAEQPLAQQAVYTETILGPGDTLFIPSGCWHYVRSLTASVSVNFWFV